MKEYLGGRLAVTVGDITAFEVDAIVNAANSGLLGGGGVDGAIHHAGGPAILEACRRVRATTHPNGLPAGQAVITTGGRLKAGKVIHTVGPVWQGGSAGEERILGQAYRSCLALAEAEGLASIAFPAVSTGVYGFPKDLAARVAARSVAEHLKAGSRLERVYLVFFAMADAETFVRAAAAELGGA